jgi:hypothetical protein
MLTLDMRPFVDALTDLPAKPADMDRILASNRGRTPVATEA